jgi:hypothetical protein
LVRDRLRYAGEGGFGPVFRGVLHGQAVAIKTLAQNSHQGHLEFARELDVLSKVGIRHPGVMGQGRLVVISKHINASPVIPC